MPARLWRGSASFRFVFIRYYLKRKMMIMMKFLFLLLFFFVDKSYFVDN